MKFRPNFFARYWATTTICRGGFLATGQSLSCFRKLVRPQLLEESCGGLKQFSNRKGFALWHLPARIFIFFVVCILPQSASAQVIISEIMYNAEHSDAKSEWIELQNVGTSSVDIAKWKINDGSNHVFNMPPKNGSTGTTVMDVGAYLILASDAAAFVARYPNVPASVIDTTLSLSNDGETITLLDASGVVVDKVKYAPTKGADGNGDSLQKISGRFSAAPPTPGSANSARQKSVVPKVAQKIPIPKTITVAPFKKQSSHTRAFASAAFADASSTQVVTSAETLSTSTPFQSTSNGLLSPWVFGALATGVAGSAAALVARQKRRGEWDIEEITDGV